MRCVLSAEGSPAVKQEEVEKWAVEVSAGTATFKTMCISFCLLFLFVLLGVIAAGVDGDKRLASVLILSLCALFNLIFLLKTLHNVAKPNIVWEKAKIQICYMHQR